MNNSKVCLTNQNISKSLMEKILTITPNSLVYKLYNIYTTENTGTSLKNVTINNKGEMTFLPKGKECVLSVENFTTAWKTDNRQAGSYGKVLRKLLVDHGTPLDEIYPKELEDIVNGLKAIYTVEGDFVIVSGEDITHHYLEDNYDWNFNTGSMGSSCMRYEGACQKATKFYAENKNCEMVVLISPINGKTRGRALLWTDEDGRKFLDRIYANDHITEAFKMYAKFNKFYHKSYQNASDGEWVNPDGVEEEVLDVTIRVDTDYSTKPYMDTFYYWSRGKISNNSGNGYDHYAQNEPSDDDDEDRCYDEHSDCYIDQDDAVYLEYINQYTHYENATECVITNEYYLNEDIVLCEGDGVYSGADGIIYLTSEDAYYYIDNVSYCEHTEDDYPSCYINFIDDLGINVHENFVDEAYESAGWVKNDDGDWEEIQKEEEEVKAATYII